MDVIEVTGRPPVSSTPLVLAIGKFDGVHIGHQAILRQAQSELNGASLAVMTFWPHPAWVLGGKDGYERALTPYAEKVKLLESFGVDRMYAVQFSRDYAAIAADTFVYEHLRALNLQRVIVGADFRFGRGGNAGVGELESMCQDIGVPVTVVGQVEENGIKVSSTQVRGHLAEGRVEATQALLGRPYAVQGRVAYGQALGRTIGFPTANLDETAAYVIPATGVYAVSVQVVDPMDGATSDNKAVQNWFGVLNAGTRPTVDGATFRIEAHLFNFSGDLYGKYLRVSFLRRVRDERKFPSVELLREQIQRDVKAVQAMLGL